MIAGLALAIALLALVLIIDALMALRSLRRSVADLGREVAQLTRGAVTTDDVQAAVAEAVAASTAPAPAESAGPVSRVPQVLRTGPVIKAMALGSGTAHAARRLRGNATNGRH